MRFTKNMLSLRRIRLARWDTRFAALFIALLAFAGCDDNQVYEKNVDFKQKVWAADSLPVFQFQINNPDQPYNIYWNVRNTVSYPFQNLYLTYYLEDTVGNTITEDLYQIDLFEPRTGKPYGSGLGDIFSHQILALPNYQFDSAGMYQIRLEQYMRRDSLPEILSVGVRVEVAEAD
jgi:gliding motility-associated lipoprotein GldH